MPCALVVMVNASLLIRLLTTGSMTVFCFMSKKLSEMADKIRKSIPDITVRAGKVKKPRITLGEVLNFIDTADRRQTSIILNVVRQSEWYAQNQADYAFGGFACKERRAAV